MEKRLKKSCQEKYVANEHIGKGMGYGDLVKQPRCSYAEKEEATEEISLVCDKAGELLLFIIDGFWRGKCLGEWDSGMT